MKTTKNKPLVLLLLILSIIQLSFFGIACASPFVGIWYSWDLAWKMALSGVIALTINHYLVNTINDFVESKLKEEHESCNSNIPRSRFQKRMEEAMKGKDI